MIDVHDPNHIYNEKYFYPDKCIILLLFNAQKETHSIPVKSVKTTSI